MTRPTLAAAFAVLTLFAAHQAVCQESESAPHFSIENATLAFVEAREYDNSPLNKLRNSVVYWFAPNRLRAIWPFDGYDLETVRNLACGGSLDRMKHPLGSKLSFVRATRNGPPDHPLHGVEVDFKHFPETGARLGNLCAWMPTIARILLQYEVLNPFGNGEWTPVTDDADARVEGSPAIPVLSGTVRSFDLNNAFRSWVSAEGGGASALAWSSSQADTPDLQVSPIPWLSDSHRVWQYSTAQDQGHARRYFLSIAADNLPDTGGSQGWRSPLSTFTWSEPPELNSEVEATLWALPAGVSVRSSNFDLVKSLDDWYLVTDKGFSDVNPTRRFEQHMTRTGSVDTSHFLSPSDR